MSTSLTRLQNFYGDLAPKLLLHAMIKEEFPGSIALLTSFGADAAVTLGLVADIDPTTPVLFLDTQKHFPETLEYGRMLQKHFGLTNLRWLTPDHTLLARTDPNNTLWQQQPNRCCWLRKVEPLNRAMEEMGLLALITGRKRYQTQERANMPIIELDDQGIFRINPLAVWSKEQHKEALAAYGAPEHPLVGKGYFSIGCEPCTVPVEVGEDERSGRWAHTVGLENEQKTECGIHIPAQSMNWSV